MQPLLFDIIIKPGYPAQSPSARSKEPRMTDQKNSGALKIGSPSELVFWASRAFAGRALEITSAEYGFKCKAEGLEIDPHIKCVDFFDPLDRAGFAPEAEITDAGMGYSFMSAIRVRFPKRAIA
jgi:hypothetical protein